MRWRDQRRSENVEDQRGVPPSVALAGGGIGTLLILVIAMLLGADPRQLMQQLPKNQPGAAGAPGGGPQAKRPLNPAEEEAKEFVSVVLATTEDVWNEQFRKQNLGRSYEEPKLHLFTVQVRSACGVAGAAVGPFYCPGDSKVYLDLSFLNELKSKFHAPGEFAEAYVVAHEVGHHIQNLLGTNRKVEAARRRMSEAESNALSVRMELQADFLAGVWAHHAQKKLNILEKGDVEAGLRAASAIGDDQIQMKAQGYVRPDAFTHGTSEQRVRWFRKGLETGDVSQGDTFSADRL